MIDHRKTATPSAQQDELIDEMFPKEPRVHQEVLSDGRPPSESCCYGMIVAGHHDETCSGPATGDEEALFEEATAAARVPTGHLEKLYRDADGYEITLLELCRTEPEWAANVMTSLQKETAVAREERDKLRDMLAQRANRVDSQNQEAEALPEPIMGEFLTPDQVREAILAWAHDHQLFPPHLDFGDTCRASVIVREDGAAVIEVFDGRQDERI